ncbi:MAG: hypothetical protein VX622_15350 [Pseudomonadota bacterium]|nr:hypothetical protein [Pseudomonadota bacterium]
MSQTNVLPGPYGSEPKPEMEVSDQVNGLVQSQISALLLSSPAFSEMPEDKQDEMRANMAKIAAYSAALVEDDWKQSRKLGQTPMVRTSRSMEFDPDAAPVPMAVDTANSKPVAKPMATGDFNPAAANQVASVTESTLNAIAFPTFVADLIKGTFNAIIDASIQQMEAFGELLSNVAKTVDDFMADNITDNNARDWVTGAFPARYTLNASGDGPQLEPSEDLTDEEASRMRRTLNLGEDADLSDVESVVVPAARRHIAQSRQQMLSSMVLMGINRVIVTRGRIKAQMGFRIDTKDAATASASKSFDMKNETKARYGWFLSPVSASTKTTVAYVSSSQKDSEHEIDVSANLSGEVDLQFKSDVFPLERFADAGVISDIQSNTANPAANQPVTSMT